MCFHWNALNGFVCWTEISRPFRCPYYQIDRWHPAHQVWHHRRQGLNCHRILIYCNCLLLQYFYFYDYSIYIYRLELHFQWFIYLELQSCSLAVVSLTLTSRSSMSNPSLKPCWSECGAPLCGTSNSYCQYCYRRNPHDLVVIVLDVFCPGLLL